MVDRRQIPVFRQEPVLVFLLSLITCGLYLIYWNIRMAEVLNVIAGWELISQVVSVLAVCCFPVHVYYYLASQVLGVIGQLTGKGEDLNRRSTQLLLLSIFFPYVAAMILQGHVNEIYAQA